MKKLLGILCLVWALYPQLVLAQVPPPSITNSVVSARGVTPYDCSGTITTGGVAQLLIPTTPANQTAINIRGFMIMNVDFTAENLCINFNGTAGAATCSTTGYYGLIPSTASTSGGTYSSQLGFGTNKNPTVVAATTGHKFTCTYW